MSIVRIVRAGAAAALPVLVLSLLADGCGKGGETARERNLLKNASFEDVVNGLPVGWEIHPFQGLETDIPAEWGVDEQNAHEGNRSFYFQATQEARRFFVLSQSVEVQGVDHVRIRGAMRTLDIRRQATQLSQANFTLTFYDKDGNRFNAQRFYDFRTQAHTGTSVEWIVEDRVVRIPDNTARVEFQCALGMEGKIWFDDVSLDVPPDFPWLTQEGKNFTFHWLAAKPYPEGSMEFQQALFENYCTRLGIPETERPRVDMYFYPDSATMYEMVGETSPKKSFWDEREVHSIFPVDDHEIVHIITKPYGVLPFAITEGTAFYLMEDYRGRPVLQVAQEVLKEGHLPDLSVLVDKGSMVRVNPEHVAPAAASFVGYLIELYGTDKFLELHRAANAATSPMEFDKGFTQVYGFTAKQADEEWKALLRKLDFSEKAGSAPPDTTGAGSR